MPEITVKPNQYQIKALKLLSDPKVEVLGLGGGKGSSKSTCARIWVMLRMIKYPDSRGLVIRKTFPELQRTFIDMIKQEYHGVYTSYNEQKHTFEFSNGSKLEMAYLDKDGDVDRYFGAEYDSIVLDEAQMSSKKVFEVLRTSLRTNNPNIKPRIVLTWNWGGPGHSYLKKLFHHKVYEEGQNPEHFAYLHGTILDNPDLMAADPTYIQRLEALPDELRKMYLKGDPDVGKGGFFTEFTTTLMEEPFRIASARMKDRLFGSLDTGTTHATSFDLWFIDEKNIIHKLLTYNVAGQTIGEHAQNIYDAISSFSWTGGAFPYKVWADPSAFTSIRLNPYTQRAPIDEFIDLFKRHNCVTQFEKANNARAQGSQIMRMIFHQKRLRYFKGYNAAFVDAITSVVTDPNNIETYQKMDGDDSCDSARYGIVGCNTQCTILAQKNKPAQAVTHRDRVLRGDFASKKNDFWDMTLKYV